MKKRLLCIVLCLALLASVLPTAVFGAQQTFSDMPAPTHWSYRALTAAVENGLLRGSGGKLTPNDLLTRGQMAAVINRAFGATDVDDISFYTDVPAKAWYYQDIAKAVRMGTFQGSGNKMRPDAPISRQEAFAVLCRAFKLPDADPSALDRFTDKASVSRWAIPELAAMAANGYVNGSNGRLNPLNSITRAEFAQVMYNMISGYYSAGGTYSDTLSGNRMINAPGVTLKDVAVDGDLIVGEGAANGDVWLDNVKISGRLVIRGGGENSVHIINGSDVGSVLIGKTGDGGVRLRTEEGCRVQAVVIDDGRDEIILEGRFNQVAVETDAPVILNNAVVTGLTVNAENADVTAAGASVIDAAKLSESAAGASLSVGAGAQIETVRSGSPGAEISGNGTVRSAEVTGDNTKFDTDGTVLHVDGAGNVTQNGNAVADGSTVVTGSGTLPEPHTHSWDDGTQTVAPTCTEAGVITYRCSCGTTKTVSVPALGHDWDQGVVTKEPSGDADGEMTFTCTRCGAKRTEPVSAKPFRIVLNEGGPDEEVLWFATLDAAIAEAGKHPEHNPPEEDPWTEYALIEVCGAAAINDLSLPAGYRLFVLSNLTLTGTISLGASDYPETAGRGAACIYIPMFDETAVTLEDLRLCDGSDPENAAISSVKASDEHRMDLLAVYGARREDGSLYEKPHLSFGGIEGEQYGYQINRDLDFTKYFDSVTLDDGVGAVRICADVNLSDVRFRNGSLLLNDDVGSVSVDGQKLFGYEGDCAVQMAEGTSCTARDDGVFLSGDVYVRDGFALGGLHFQPAEEEATVTVAPGVGVDLLGDCEIGQNVSFVNNGVISLSGWLDVRGSLDNSGTIRLVAEESEDPGFWYIGSLNLSEATLRNTGTLELMGGEGQPRAQVDGYSSSICNDEGGIIRNSGDLRLRGGSLVNTGLIENNCRLELNPGDEQWIRYKSGGGTPEQVQAAHPCSMLNSGSIRNHGEICLEGVQLTNDGSIRNDRELRISERIQCKEVFTLESLDGEPENDDDWQSFWDWDWSRQDEGERAWLRVSGCERTFVSIEKASFENSGVLENYDELRLESTVLTNTRTGIVNNEGGFELYANDIADARRFVADIPENVRFSEPSFTNAGKFANGVITGVGAEDGGSRAWFRQNEGSIDNQGEITNNGDLNWFSVDYTQDAGARFETYNAGGTHITGGSLSIPSGAFFRNEGYMRIADRFGEGGEKCNLDGFPDFFTTWNTDGNDSNWCDFTAEVLDEAGYSDAVAAQRALPDNMKYNRLDFCDDITFTHDVTLEDFGNYWVQSRDATAWHVFDEETGWQDCEESVDGAEPYGTRVGSTLTIAKGAVLTVAADNYLHIDGDWFDDRVSPCGLTVHGTLRIAGEHTGPEGREWEYLPCASVEIWSFGRFENDGAVDNQGVFEVRYYDFGHQEEDRYVHEGRLERLPECAVINPPASTIHAAEVRSVQGLNNAVASTVPEYDRIYIREDCTLTLTENLTIPVSEIHIEPGSGFIAEHGCLITIPEGTHVWNDGDVSIYGDLLLVGEFENHQHMEVGAVTGNKNATVSIRGELRNWGDLQVYPTGRIELADEGRFSGCTGMEFGTLRAEAEGNADYTLSVYDDGYGSSFQVDASGDGTVRLSGTLPEEYDSLRIMQGNVDIRNLSVSDKTQIFIDDMWNTTRAVIGTHEVIIDDGSNPEGMRGYEIEAEPGAVIRVQHAQLIYDGGYRGTDVGIHYGGRNYWLSPHIFGVIENRTPAVYISTDDPDVEYELRLDGQRLQFVRDLILEDGKTHLNRAAGSGWFTAGWENTPNLELTIRLPEGPTVIFETVPVKPEWDEDR